MNACVSDWETGGSRVAKEKRLWSATIDGQAWNCASDGHAIIGRPATSTTYPRGDEKRAETARAVLGCAIPDDAHRVTYAELRAMLGEPQQVRSSPCEECGGTGQACGNRGCGCPECVCAECDGELTIGKYPESRVARMLGYLFNPNLAACALAALGTVDDGEIVYVYAARAGDAAPNEGTAITFAGNGWRVGVTPMRESADPDRTAPVLLGELPPRGEGAAR